MNPILVASYSPDITEHLRLAREYGCGLEIQAFSNPSVMEYSWRELLARYKEQLRNFEGPLSFHGAFFDMSTASPDPRIVAVTRQRYLLSMDIAAELGAKHIVFHTNFLPMIRTEQYRREWIERQREFWSEMSEELAKRDLEVALENMWDPDPFVLHGLFYDLTIPHLGICLDVSHAYLYRHNKKSDVKIWFDVLAPYIIHVHMNNSRGVVDEHLALNVTGGALNYARLLPYIFRLPRTPWLIIEIDNHQALEQSLAFLQRLYPDHFHPRR